MNSKLTMRTWCAVALLVGAGAAQAQDAPAAGAATAAIVSGPAGQVTLAELELIANEMVPPARRSEFWSNPEAVGRLARSIYAQRALAADATKAGLDKTAQGAAYLKLIRERALTELAMQQQVRAKAPDTKTLDAYARSEYKANPKRFATPEQVHVRHILLPVAKDGSDDAAVKTKAGDLLAQLRNGADFAKLAAEHSADKANAQRGGDLGFFARGRMVPAFDNAAFALQKKGELGGPVRTDFGYHIIELVERRPAGRQTLEQAQPALNEELLGKINTEERLKAWGAAEAAGKVNDDEVARIVKSRAR